MGRRKERNRAKVPKNRRKKSLRERIVGVKIHGLIFIGLNVPLWLLWVVDGALTSDPWPLAIALPWGTVLFLHYVIRVLGFKWREEAKLKDAAERSYIQEDEQPYFSSEYSLHNSTAEKRPREDWDGVDVSIHDVGDQSS